MKILLTGGSGQVGTEVRRRRSGAQLLAPARAQMDLGEPASVSDFLRDHQPDLILSVGAYTAVDRAEDEAEAAYAANRDGVQALADWCAAHSRPLIHVSTDYVFDGSKTEAYVESDAVNPLGVYGHSKLAGEVAARSHTMHLILRVSWVFSSHGQNFVKTMLRLAASRDELRVVDDQFGGPTWAGDIAETLLELADRWQRQGTLPWGCYHYAGSPALSWCGFAQAIVEQGAQRGLIAKAPRVLPIRTEDYPTRARRPANSRLDSSRFSETLGLPMPDWRLGLERTLQDLQALS